MLSQNNNGGGENGIFNSWSDSTQVNSATKTLANPPYLDYVLE